MSKVIKGQDVSPFLVYVETPLHAEMKAVCAAYDWSLRAFVRRAIREKLATMQAGAQ